MVACLLLFEVDDPLPAFQRADIAFVDNRIVAEPLRRITAGQKNTAGNLFVLVPRRIEVGNGADFRFGQILSAVSMRNLRLSIRPFSCRPSSHAARMMIFSSLTWRPMVLTE